MGGSNYPENLVFNDLWILQVKKVDPNTMINLKGAEWINIGFPPQTLPYLKGHTIHSSKRLIRHDFKCHRVWRV